MTPKKNFCAQDRRRSLQGPGEKWAGDEFRSVNGQIEWLISRQLKEAGRIKKGRKDEKDPTTHNPKK